MRSFVLPSPSRLLLAKLAGGALSTLVLLRTSAGNAAESSSESRAVEPSASADNDKAFTITSPTALATPLPDLETSDDTQVILELVVTKDGLVKSAAVQSGSEPYASAAANAAREWTFAPATRGGQPIATKILFLVTFTKSAPPTALDPEPEDGAPKPETSAKPEGPKPPRSTAAPLVEVLVVGEWEESNTTGFTRSEVQNLPGAFGDPLRSVEILPGVSPIATGLPLFFVRGAPPGNVGYFVDGIRVPLLYHAFLGPSVIHPAFLEQVNLHAGPIPARFGRYAGAAVEANLAKPRDKFRAEANLRLIDAGAFVETPFADGRGYILLGGRYSYTALLISAFSPGQRLDYWDYQALVGYRVGKRDEISMFAFGAYDFASTNGGATAGGTEFQRVDLRWDHDYSTRTKSRLAVALGRDRTRSEQGFVSDLSIAPRFHLESRLDEEVLLRAGGDLSVDNYELDVLPSITEPEVYRRLFPTRVDVTGGAYADLVLFPGARFEVVPGVRADVWRSLGDTQMAVGPRLSATFRPFDDWSITHAAGLAHQGPNFVPGVPGAQVGGLRGGLQESVHASSTLAGKLPWDIDFTFAAFLNATSRLTDPIGLSQSLAIDETTPDRRSFGRAGGFEVFLKRPLSRRLGGLVSYTFMHTLRSTELLTTIPGYDRPHLLNLALTYDFGSNFRASARFAFASGVPGRRTTLDGFVFDRERSDPYLRLDLKVEKRWYVSEQLFWGTYLEVLNATYTGNVASRTCNSLGCQDQASAPITFPSLGAELGWN